MGRLVSKSSQSHSLRQRNVEQFTISDFTSALALAKRPQVLRTR
jgi:hypothetical protein